MNTVTDWNLVKSFVVAEHSHRADAARQLGISERTLRRRLAQLEAEVGVALVDRAQTTLTPAGRWLREALAHPLALADNALREAHRHTAPMLAIAISAELPNHWTGRVSDWIQAIDQTARLEQRAPEEVLALLDAGALDLALVAREPPGHRGQVVGDEPLVVIFPQDHPAADQTTVRPGDLDDLPVVVSEHATDDWRDLALHVHAHGSARVVAAPRRGTIGQSVIHSARVNGAAAIVLAFHTTQADTAGLVIRPLDPPLAVPVTLAASADVPDALTASLTDHLVDTPQLPQASTSQRRPRSQRPTR